MLMALQAGASGIGWTPVPGLIGTDLLARRPDFKVVDDPYQPGRQVVLVPALRPQFALVHARRADPRGNAVIATAYDDRLLIQAAETVIMSVETVAAGATDHLHAGEQVIPAAFVDVLTVAAYESPGRATAQHLEHAAQR
jgi:glutaconate CoA-transferase subunit A